MARTADPINPLCQASAREFHSATQSEISRETEPRPDESEGDADGMNCSAVAWALSQDVSSASASRLLIEIARHSVGGRCAATQIALGSACKLSERQTRTLLASLVADKAIERTRQGGEGKGRAPDLYVLRGYVEDCACEQPAISAASHEATGNDAHIAATGNGQSSPEAMEQPAIDDRKNLPVEATGNSAPTPPIRTTSAVEDNLQTPEPDVERGLGGGLFGDAPQESAPPKAKKPKGASRRPRREKFYATEEAMPAEPNAEMAAYAASKHLVNGTRAEQFGKFCRYHIRNRTLIASLEGRWETWVDNWAKSNPPRPDGAVPVGYKLAGIGADGKARYVKDHRTNVYR